MSSIEQLKAVVQNEIALCMMKIDKLNVQFAAPQVRYDLTGRCFGRAIGHTTIRVNPAVALAVGIEEYRKTVAHEVAHNLTWWLVCNFKAHHLLKGDTNGGHGKGWKSVMVFLGQEPIRCAPPEEAFTASAAGALGKTFTYVCKCNQPHAFSQRRHNAVGRGQVYTCRTCHQVLVYKPK